MAMIEIKNISKWYGNFQVLKDCSVDVEKGEVVVVCGPSGSGKSTLIKTVNALEPFQKGEIIVDGISVGDPKTNVYAGIFARDGNDVIINGSKNVLSLELTNDIGSPVGIYAGNGKNVKLDVKGLIVNGTVNVAPEYGNSITNAI